MKNFFCILFLGITITCKAQGVKKCTVYQFVDNDSNKKHVALVQAFNNRGQVITEQYSSFAKSINEGNSDGTYHYYYNDTLLAKKIFIADNKDTFKILYHYNNQGHCIKEEHYTSERRVRKDAKKGLGQPGGCVVFEKDLDKERTWQKTNEVSYSYDDKGRTIKKTDEMDYTRTWKYDEKNRIIEEKGYSSPWLAYSEDYEYFDGGYRYATIHYDSNGDPEPAKYSNIEFSPLYTCSVYLNKEGKIINEEITTEKGVKISYELTYYDSNGRIIRTIHRYLDRHFLKAGEPYQVTHIFEYK